MLRINPCIVVASGLAGINPYAPTKGELENATYNGVNALPDMTVSEKEIEFVDEYTYNSLSPPPDTQPEQQLKQKLPFGSFGINLGIRIDL